MPSTAPRKPIAWLALSAVSIAAGTFLHVYGFPAAFLIAAMLSGIVFTLSGAGLSLPRPFFIGSQSLIGCGVASSISTSILVTIGQNWLVMLLIVASTLLAGGLVGWLLTRLQALPGTTAAWGSTPGAAGAMVAMAEAYGADVRLVALMQYLRVLVVVLSVSLVAHFYLEPAADFPLPTTAGKALFSLGEWTPLIAGLAVAGAGGLLGIRLGIPAGAMLVPMILGALLHASGTIDLHQPLWLRALASLLLGWFVGLRFDRAFLSTAYRLVPRLLLFSVVLIGLCVGPAWALVHFLHIDPLTAYLSTSPGGLDSLILIAMGSSADIPFVVATQTLRFFLVILAGPFVARLICRYAGASQTTKE